MIKKIDTPSPPPSPSLIQQEPQKSTKSLNEIYLEKYESCLSRYLMLNLSKMIDRGNEEDYTLDNLWILNDEYYSKYIIDQVLIPLQNLKNSKFRNSGVFPIIWEIFHSEWLITFIHNLIMKIFIV